MGLRFDPRNDRAAGLIRLRIYMDNKSPDDSGNGQTTYMGVGIAIGMGLGLVFGMLMDNLAIGVAIGAGVGVALGAAMGASRRK